MAEKIDGIIPKRSVILSNSLEGEYFHAFEKSRTIFCEKKGEE